MGNFIENLLYPNQTDAAVKTAAEAAAPAAGGWTWVDNGAGGVNYLFNGAPSTREYFAINTHQDPGAIEKWVADQYAAKAKNPGDPTVTGTAGGGTSAADAAYWAAQGGSVDDQLGRLDNQGAIGKANLLDSYTAAFNTLTNNKGRDERNYNTNRDNTIQDNVTAKNNIDLNVQSTNTGLQRLLGARGAGSSSAATILAPYAAATEGNRQRGQVQQVYGRNMGALDTGWNDTVGQYDTSFGQLDTEKANKDRALEAGILSTRAGLLAKKQEVAQRLGTAADPTIAAQIASLGGQVDNLGRTSTFTPKLVDYKAPDLAAYDYSKNTVNTGPTNPNVDPSAIANTGAYWTLLGQNDKKKQQGLVPALA